MNPLVFTGLPYSQQIKRRRESKTTRHVLDGGYIPELEAILDRVCKYLELNVSNVKTKNRKRTHVTARFYYFYLARMYTKHSLASIGAVVGRDHATVLHGVSEIGKYLTFDKEIINKYLKITRIVWKSNLS